MNQMRTIRLTIADLFEFEGQPVSGSPDVATVTGLVLKQFGFLPQPLTVQIESNTVIIQFPSRVPANNHRGQLVSYGHFRRMLNMNQSLCESPFGL